MSNQDHFANPYDVATTLVGAWSAVRVLAPLTSDWILPVDREFLSYATDSRLDRRYIVTNPRRPDYQEEAFLRELHSLGWQVMWVNAPRSLVGILVDDEVAFISAGTDRAFWITNPDVVSGLSDHFERTWNTGSQNVGARILFDDVLITTSEQPAPQIHVATQDQWNSILSSLADQPFDIHYLEPRRFEELVAELLQRDHPQDLIRLTPSTKDGGRDILVFSDTPIGRHLFLVECKRYAPNRPIDVGMVRQLYGVVEAERASAGALVTSSYFTSPAKQWPIDHKLDYRMTLRDFDDLVAWVDRHAPKIGGSSER